MKGSQSIFKAGEQSESCDFLFLLTSAAEHRLGGFKIHITKFIEPEVIESISSLSQAKSVEVIIHVLDGFVEFSQNPTVEEILLGGVDVSFEVLDEVNFRLHKLVSLPNLITKLSEGHNFIDVQVD